MRYRLWAACAVVAILVGCSARSDETADPLEVAVEKSDAAFWPFAGGGNFRMIVDPQSDPRYWRSAAEAKCGERDYCMVLAWTDAAAAPVVLPMTDAEVAAQAFSYRRNRNTGLNEAAWDCSRYPSAGACLSD